MGRARMLRKGFTTRFKKSALTIVSQAPATISIIISVCGRQISDYISGMTTTHSHVLASIARTIADYREGEIALPSAGHVGRWVEQFPDAVRQPLAVEMAHVLDKTYIAKKQVQVF